MTPERLEALRAALRVLAKDELDRDARFGAVEVLLRGMSDLTALAMWQRGRIEKLELEAKLRQAQMAEIRAEHA